MLSLILLSVSLLGVILMLSLILLGVILLLSIFHAKCHFAETYSLLLSYCCQVLFCKMSFAEPYSANVIPLLSVILMLSIILKKCHFAEFYSPNVILPLSVILHNVVLKNPFTLMSFCCQVSFFKMSFC
jgi:hypothetical protein